MQPHELKEYIYNNNKIAFVLESIGVHDVREMTTESEVVRQSMKETIICL